MWPENFKTFIDIFWHGEYAVQLDNPKIVFDLGAHVGYASLYFAWCYPKAIIYAFEPDPYTFKKLVRNTRFCRRIIPIRKAVTSANGYVTLYHSPSSISSSLYRISKAGKTEPVTVQSTRLDTFMHEHDIRFVDFLKFDIEGAECSVFSDLDFSKFGSIIGEYHEYLTGMDVSKFASLFYSPTIRTISPKRYVLTSITRCGQPQTHKKE
jgi:FkbM family methyltransferase